MKCLAHGFAPATEAEQTLGKIAGVGHHPQRGAVAVDHQRKPATQPMQGSEIDTKSRRNPGVAVGERGPHDGDRESVPSVCLHEELLGGNLLLRVLPKRVGERRFLVDDVVLRRLLVDRGRADEHVLPDLAGEHLHIGGRLCRVEHDPVDHHVERFGSQRLRHGAPVVEVAVDGAHAGRQVDPAQAPVEMHQLDAALCGKA